MQVSNGMNFIVACPYKLSNCNVVGDRPGKSVFGCWFSWALDNLFWQETELTNTLLCLRCPAHRFVTIKVYIGIFALWFHEVIKQKIQSLLMIHMNNLLHVWWCHEPRKTVRDWWSVPHTMQKLFITMTSYERDGVSDHQPHDCLLNRVFKAQIEKNIKTPRHCTFCGEFTGGRWILRTKSQLRGKCFHLFSQFGQGNFDPWYSQIHSFSESNWI